MTLINHETSETDASRPDDEGAAITLQDFKDEQHLAERDAIPMPGTIGAEQPEEQATPDVEPVSTSVQDTPHRGFKELMSSFFETTTGKVAAVAAAVGVLVAGVAVVEGSGSDGPSKVSHSSSSAPEAPGVGKPTKSEVVVDANTTASATNLNKYFLNALLFTDHFDSTGGTPPTPQEIKTHADTLWNSYFTANAKTEFANDLPNWESNFERNMTAMLNGNTPVVKNADELTNADASKTPVTSDVYMDGADGHYYIHTTLVYAGGRWQIDKLAIESTNNDQ